MYDNESRCVDTSATLSCKMGYSLVPPGLVRVVECGVAVKLQFVKVSQQIRVSFLKTSKFAAIHCSPIELIVNGSIIYSPDMTANFDLGTEATYSCNTGFFLDVSEGNRSSGQNIKFLVPFTCVVRLKLYYKS